MESSNSSGFANSKSVIAVQDDQDEENIVTRKNKEPAHHFEMQDILCSSEKAHQELWHGIEEDEQLLELLWNRGPVTKPVMNEENDQLFIREDEMSRELDCLNETSRATVDYFSEFIEPSLRNISNDEVKEIEGNIRNLSEESLRAANSGDVCKVNEAVHEKAAVECSLHGNCNPRKRKERDVDDIYGTTLETSQPPPLRRHAAEIHNNSEKRRRDRINEKMATLQKLIPRCHKSDKASILDDAIEYLKSLQLQVQMMSTTLQYNMGQTMFPKTQRYMGCMGNLCMGMNRPSVEMQRPIGPSGPLMPYPTMMQPQYASSSHTQPNPSFHMGVASIPDARIEASNHDDLISNRASVVSSGMVQLPNISEPYHYCSGLHYHQAPT